MVVKWQSATHFFVCACTLGPPTGAKGLLLLVQPVTFKHKLITGKPFQGASTVALQGLQCQLCPGLFLSPCCDILTSCFEISGADLIQ